MEPFRLQICDNVCAKDDAYGEVYIKQNCTEDKTLRCKTISTLCQEHESMGSVGIKFHLEINRSYPVQINSLHLIYPVNK